MEELSFVGYIDHVGVTSEYYITPSGKTCEYFHHQWLVGYYAYNQDYLSDKRDKTLAALCEQESARDFPAVEHRISLGLTNMLPELCTVIAKYYIAMMPRPFPAPRNNIHLLCEVNLRGFRLVSKDGEDTEYWRAPNALTNYERYVTSWWRMGDADELYVIKPPLSVFLDTRRKQVLGLPLR